MPELAGLKNGEEGSMNLRMMEALDTICRWSKGIQASDAAVGEG